jgi:hypothetical protein
VRRIALRPPIRYFGSHSFGPTPPIAVTLLGENSALRRFRATVAGIKSDWWVVEEPGDTQSLPAAASGASSADIEDGSDEE